MIVTFLKKRQTKPQKNKKTKTKKQKQKKTGVLGLLR
jgi:hypothetical protein